MKKNNKKGFMLVETLLVTTFVSGTLLYLYSQFSNLNKNYNESFYYNGVEEMYALGDVKNLINADGTALNAVQNSIPANGYIDITDCSIFTDSDYCLRLYELNGIDKIIVTYNEANSLDFDSSFNDKFKAFANKLGGTGDEQYRLIAMFSASQYATIRF